MAINFPLKAAFAVSHWFWQVVFSFSLTSKRLLISSLYFFSYQLIIEQCVIQPAICFSAVAFVVKF
jgi:hypothetical protein